MGYISTASTLIQNPDFLQSGLFSSNQGESPGQFWNNQLAQYNQDRFKIETPQLNPFTQQNNPFQNVMPDYAQQFRDNTQAGTRNMNIQVGTVLQGSSDPSAQLLGKQMVQDNLNLGDASQQIQAPDVSHLTGANINYGQQFMQAGTQLAGQLASQIGGQAGQIASGAIKAGSSIYNAVSNIKEINTAAKARAQGLGKAKAGNAMAIAGAVADLAGSFLPEKTEYNGPKGDITQTMDSVYDGISDAAMSFGPVGMMVGGIMKGGKLLGGVMNSVGGGTDGMTTTDAILGSSFLNLTPIGLINGFGGQKAETITKNEEAFETVGASYTGSNQSVNAALQKSGKKYGLLSSGARKKANEEILEARRQQGIITDIADQATDRFAIRNSMAAINGNRRALAMQGGYNQAAIQFGRKGMVIAKRIASQYKMQEKRKASDPFQSYLNTIPEDQRTISKEQWELAGSPSNFGEALARGMFQYGEQGWEMVEEFKEGGKIDNVSVLVEVDIDSLPEEFKDGGVLGSSIIKEVETEEMVEEFKEGGSFNVIPEGALHARLHHMENAENLTKKGIPVVSEKEGGELEQHAEIEKEEIILRLSLTKRLEELAKEDTDEAALEAGKILVEEILNNTVDNTNTLL